MVLGKRTAVGGLILAASRLCTRVIDFISILILARYLSPNDFGLVALPASIIAILEAVFELPVYQALMRLPTLRPSYLDTAFTLSLMRGLILGVITLLAAYPAYLFYNDPTIPPLVCFLGLAPALRGLNSPRIATYQKDLSFWRDAVIEIAGKITAFLITVSVAVVTGSYWALPCGTVVFAAAMLIISYIVAPYRPKLTLQDLPVFLSFFGWSSVGQIIGSINWQFERMLLGKYKSPADFGLFTTANDVANMPLQALFTPLMRPLLAAFSHQSLDRASLAITYQKISGLCVMIGLPLLVGQSLTAHSLVITLLGEKFAGSGYLLQWLSLSLIPTVFIVPSSSVIIALDNIKIFVRRNIVDFSIKIPLLLVLIPSYGFGGVIATRMAAELVVGVYSMKVVYKLLGLSVLQQILNSWRSIAGTVVMAITVTIIDEIYLVDLFPGPSAMHLNSMILVGFFAFISSSILFWLVSGKPEGPELIITRFLYSCWEKVSKSYGSLVIDDQMGRFETRLQGEDRTIEQLDLIQHLSTLLAEKLGALNDNEGAYISDDFSLLINAINILKEHNVTCSPRLTSAYEHLTQAISASADHVDNFGSLTLAPYACFGSSPEGDSFYVERLGADA